MIQKLETKTGIKKKSLSNKQKLLMQHLYVDHLIMPAKKNYYFLLWEASPLGTKLPK